MIFKPHVYQEHSRKMILYNPYAGLFLEMGLGKTVVTLTAINDLKYDYFKVRKVLVIAPKKVAENTWTDEAAKWDHLWRLKLVKILGPAKDRLEAINAKADVYLINRENVVWLIEQYGRYRDKKKKTGFILTKPWPYDMVVIDELSSFKSSSSSRFKMLKKIKPQINRLVGLTGTPAPNGLMDLWSQVYLLDEGKRLGKNKTAYRDRYFIPTGSTFNANGREINIGYVPRQGSQQAIYSSISDICVSMQAKDWLNMPPRIDNYVMVPLSLKSMSLYKKLERDTILQFTNGDVIDAGSAAVLSGKLHQLAQGIPYIDEEKNHREIHSDKLQALDDLIEAAQGRPVLVLYWFKPDLQRLKARYKTARELKTPQDKEDWNNGKIPILLAHPASSGHGLNLQAGGNIIIWYSLTWSLELYQQTNARLYRQGQQNSVIINHLIARGTVDERIIKVLHGKATLQGELMEATKAVVYENRSR